MDNQLQISICIPAYKQTAFLKRLLDSVAVQSFRNYEIVVTDDSPDESVQQLCLQYPHLPLRYFRNQPALGSPGNWNSAIAHARGEWIKIMHDDDWFSTPESLEKFAQLAQQSPAASFLFSGVFKVNVESGQQSIEIPGTVPEKLLKRSPLYLFKKNYIGHPSTTMIKNNIKDWYDEKVKWVVDFEFYIRYLLQFPAFAIIPEPLVCIGISNQQITKEAFRNPAIEIPEHLYLFGKLPAHSLRNWVVYDYFWRLWRNLAIRHEEQLQPYAGGEAIPAVFRNMIRWQRAIPASMLRFGPASKLIMSISYLANYPRL